MMMLIFDVDVYVVYAADDGDVDSNIDIDFVWKGHCLSPGEVLWRERSCLALKVVA